jgi:hypothetical protein
LPLV